MKQKCKKN